jgi:hypothetical protein
MRGQEATPPKKVTPITLKLQYYTNDDDDDDDDDDVLNLPG